MGLHIVMRVVFLILLGIYAYQSIRLKKDALNMNGEYLISNPNTVSGIEWSSDYGKYENVEYMDVYSPPISSRYGDVFWTMMDPVPLDEEFVKRFDGRSVAFVGYEVDQVQRTENGDISVPITWAYNHHYCAFINGKKAEIRQVNDFIDTQDMKGAYNHGGKALHNAFLKEGLIDEDEDSEVPISWFISEGNGGEFRKSYHGYPMNYAQLIDSPATFHIQPMQIDTKNRHYNGSDFRADLLPKNSAAPPNASYSGLLECPCTDRKVKKIEYTFSTQTEGVCSKMIPDNVTCFEAAQTVAGDQIGANITTGIKGEPSGCYISHDGDGSINAYFNTEETSVACGEGGTQLTGSFKADKAVTSVSLNLDNSVADGRVTITLGGPSDKWFSVGFNTPNFQMSDLPYTIVVDGSGKTSELKLGDHDPGTPLSASVTVTSNSEADGVRTVVMTREFQGKTQDHFTFDPESSSIPCLFASGRSSSFSYHGPDTRTGGTLKLNFLDSATCVCPAGMSGSINGVPFKHNCRPEPMGDLIFQKNPTCWIDTYQGGQECCHHKTILLDKDQEQPEDVLTYHMKFRFYYQEYMPASNAVHAWDQGPSHSNLIRLYHQTEAYASEYDVPQCGPGTPTEQCVHMITSHFTVMDMANNCGLRKSPNCWGNMDAADGVEIIYAAGHCHAPSCISMELYHADTGKLLCAHYPTFGQSHEVFDEQGYITIPPCIFGSEEEGLLPPTFLPFNANLTSIKRNNNTFGHYGEMASWQMRGVLALKP